MTYEPAHALDDLRQRFREAAMNPERVDELRSLLADDYVHFDRRRVVGLPDLDGAGIIESIRFGHRAGLESYDARLLATRGDRLVMNQVTTRFADGSEKQYLLVSRWDRNVAKVERTVRFDDDDLAGAMSELDRMHTEIEAEDPSPPTR